MLSGCDCLKSSLFDQLGHWEITLLKPLNSVIQWITSTTTVRVLIVIRTAQSVLLMD
jgi:hypothetical protein